MTKPTKEIKPGRGSKIKLKSGVCVFVDKEDFKILTNGKYNWHLSNGYVASTYRENGKQKSHKMHRLIMNAPKGMEVDHINHNKLDNRRSNLRLASKSQNMMNRIKLSGKTSKFKGVYLDGRRGKWVAQIMHNGDKIFLGSFVNERDAFIAYKDSAIKRFGDFAFFQKPTRDYRRLLADAKAYREGKK